MKKVKILLSALVVVAVVGGTLAFKAAAFEDFYCIVEGIQNVDQNTPAEECDVLIQTREAETGTFFLATPNPEQVPCHELTCEPLKLDQQD